MAAYPGCWLLVSLVSRGSIVTTWCIYQRSIFTKGLDFGSLYSFQVFSWSTLSNKMLLLSMSDLMLMHSVSKFWQERPCFQCSYLSFIPKAVNMIAGCEDYFCCSCCGRFAIYRFRHSLVQTGLLAPQSRSGKLHVSAMRCFSSCRVLWTKNPWFGYFWAGIWKEYCRISNQHPQIFLIAKFQEKTKMLKFGTKNTLFQYFRAGIWKQYSHI